MNWRAVFIVLICLLMAMPAHADTQTAPVPDSELDADQEISETEMTDEPIPWGARGKKLYILDEEQQLVPAEDWSGQEMYGYGDMQIPQLYQYDYRQTICYFYGTPKSVATSGCGATSMSMVIAYLTGNKCQTPYTLFRWAVNNGMYEGSGLSHSTLIEIGAMYGVSGEWIAADEQIVRAALMQGYPVIAHMGPGHFTYRGHYIVLRGLTNDGKILVNDPNSWRNSMTSFDYQAIESETKTKTPYFICYKYDE